MNGANVVSGKLYAGYKDGTPIWTSSEIAELKQVLLVGLAEFRARLPSSP